MKARVKATGEIIDVKSITKYSSNYEPSTVYEDVTDGVIYKKEFLDFENITSGYADVKEKSLPKDEPDYWEKLKHQYAGMAMQAYIIGNQINSFGFSESPKDMEMCVSIATALVDKLKEEQK